jgi:hypothetical protein
MTQEFYKAAFLKIADFPLYLNDLKKKRIDWLAVPQLDSAIVLIL